ncbi:uncharacterized protein BDZ99DRAFT_406676 [Mytilinidion resinicola]|uniref:GAT domain-containing protein n=1 Tax=Mytilinidion resinicola TaxID=574789 RepID=A0A6A6Z776_9PEZI|nr:uncharacterized protein BDZ99DRAFT_406676 [Mytilinidion resinicola]KAF2816154.1 hypothetical protein BDZ99DRAFT_406676 [Mytilinidion resinicola]
MVLKRFQSMLNKRPGGAPDDSLASDLDTPEANAARGVRLFCESGSANTGEEVLHLPIIVESAVASPNAAAAACSQIKKFLSKENYTRPHVQYNAIMLIRILADNPGQSFTKNMDKSFADTVKHLLRNGRDPSVGQILRETLDALERDKAYDTNLNAVFAMWRKEKGLMASAGHPPQSFGPRTLNAPAWSGGGAPPGVTSESYGRNSRPERALPPPTELSARVEEARTSAKLLLQLVQSTPPNELPGNDLVKEFADRCLAAQRSIQNYINCDNPPPDDDTMLTLIETNEQLSLAASKHQRAVLQARKVLGPSPVPTPPISTANNDYPLPAIPQSSAPQLPPFTQTNSISPRDPNPIPAYTAPSPIPIALQAAPHRTRTASPSSNYPDDPFSDHGSNAYDHPASPSNAPPPPPPPRTSGSPNSYHPGYSTSPSYLQRQESAGNNVTMHGGASPPNGGEQDAWSSEPRTPEQVGRRPVGGGVGRRESEDVSPVAEREQVTYRY